MMFSRGVIYGPRDFVAIVAAELRQLHSSQE